MTEYYLGVDIGNTKSHALVADERGRVAGFAKAGPGNWETVGWQTTRSVLHDIIRRAAAQAGTEPQQLAGAGFGIAGYDWPEDRPPHVEIIGEVLGPAVPFELVNDGFIGLWAGTDAGWGVVVSAGTSCNCWGRNARGDIGRVTGSSYLGEYAGAGELVWWAVQAVARAWSQRGPATRLTEAFLELSGAADAGDLMAGLMRARYHIGSQHAPVVFAVAAAGDAVADGLVRQAGDELGRLGLGVARQVDITGLEFDVVLAGSFYNGSPLVQEAMAARIHGEAPGARLVRLDASPAVGGVLLGMEQVGKPAVGVRQALVRAAVAAGDAGADGET